MKKIQKISLFRGGPEWTGVAFRMVVEKQILLAL
jgi:hypothetical protein